MHRYRGLLTIRIINSNSNESPHAIVVFPEIMETITFVSNKVFQHDPHLGLESFSNAQQNDNHSD